MHFLSKILLACDYIPTLLSYFVILLSTYSIYYMIFDVLIQWNQAREHSYECVWIHIILNQSNISNKTMREGIKYINRIIIIIMIIQVWQVWFEHTNIKCEGKKESNRISWNYESFRLFIFAQNGYQNTIFVLFIIIT